MDAATIGLKIVEVLSPLLLAALTWAAAKLAQLAREKIKNEQLSAALVRLDDVALVAVKELQQTVVDGIKAASADGKITAEERHRIKAKALANVKSHLGVKGISEVAKVLGLEAIAVEGLLSSKVEAAVHDLRRVAPATAASAMGGTPPLASPPVA